MDRIDDPFPVLHWESLGYSQEHAVAMTQLSDALIDATSVLNQSSQAEAGSAIEAYVYLGIDEDAANALPERSLFPDASLLPLWKQFTDELGSLATNEHVSIDLDIGNIQLSTRVLSILEPALKVTPLEKLLFYNNRLGRDGINFVTSVLEENRSLSNLCLRKNEIEIDGGHGALSLVEAARDHPVMLKEFRLAECGIDRILQITPEIVPALLSLTAVDLNGNGLGSHAASLISNCLATNPGIKALSLHDNLFNDDDASLFAITLRTNTNLNRLWLDGNNFTDAGVKTLYKSVYDEQSLNTIYVSNHTCKLILFDKGALIPNGKDAAVLLMNGKRFKRNIFPEPLHLKCERAANGNARVARKLLKIEGRKKIKLLHAIQGGNTGRFNMKWIEDVPVELMPNVFVFLQESGKYAGTEDRSLDRLFQVIRARQEVTSFHGVLDDALGIQPQYKKRRIGCHKSN